MNTKIKLLRPREKKRRVLNDYAMKTIFVTFILSVIPLLTIAAPTSYCSDMTRVGNLPRLSEDQFKRHLQEKGSVDRILVSKARRELYLINDDVVLKTYKVAFGQDSKGGAKQFEGDQKTPEGIYSIDYKNPQSAYYLGLHVSYPNDQDKAFAKARGKSPGGDIMVHGFPTNPEKHIEAMKAHPGDWTDGCIAMLDTEINQVYSLVKERTTIEICKLSDK